MLQSGRRRRCCRFSLLQARWVVTQAERIAFPSRGPLRTSGEGTLRRAWRACPDRQGGHHPAEARAIAAELGGRVVVKAQVKTGGRGKAGGVKVADGAATPRPRPRQILGMDIKGHTVHKVLVEQASDIAEEYYASFLLDRANRTFLSMGSREGGVEIEEVAATKPEALARIPVDALKGVAARRPARSRSRPSCRRRRWTAPPRCWASSGTSSSRRRHAGRGQPADPHRRRPGGRARRQGHPR